MHFCRSIPLSFLLHLEHKEGELGTRSHPLCLKSEALVVVSLAQVWVTRHHLIAFAQINVDCLENMQRARSKYLQRENKKLRQMKLSFACDDGMASENYVKNIMALSDNFLISILV